MKNNKGMTLIEVILSISLIALIGAVFLSSFNHSLFVIDEGRKMTKETFTAQQQIEKSIEIAKMKKEEQYDSRFFKTEYQLFGKKIKGVLITQPSFGDNTIKVFIPNEVDTEEKLPIIKTDSVKINPVGPLYPYSGEKLTGTSEVDNKNKEYLFMKLNRWYVSNEGFDGYVPDEINNENEGMFGERFPIFPADYQQIENDSTILGDLGRFVGRHIVYSVTPIDRLGRFGTEVDSKPVYIMGPPVLNSLSFHMDSYTLRDGNDTFIPDDGDISEWKDYSTNRVFTPGYSTFNEMKLSYFEQDGKALNFDKTSLKIDFNPTTKNSFTAFIVYRNVSEESVNSYNIIRRRANNENGWEIGLYDGKLGFAIKQQNSVIKNITQASNAFANDKYIVTALYSSGNMKLILDRNDNKEELNAGFSYTVDNRNPIELIIGDANVNNNIYEIIIYDAALSEDEIIKVRNYLSEKHGVNIRK